MVNYYGKFGKWGLEIYKANEIVSTQIDTIVQTKLVKKNTYSYSNNNGCDHVDSNIMDWISKVYPNLMMK